MQPTQGQRKSISGGRALDAQPMTTATRRRRLYVLFIFPGAAGGGREGAAAGVL